MHDPLTHALPLAQGEQLAVGVPQLFAYEPHVQDPARQVVPLPHTAPHVLQLASSLARSTQPDPQQIVPALQTWLWLPTPPQATQWELTQVSVAFGQDAGPRQVHCPLSQVPPGPHAEQPTVPGVQALLLAPQAHLPATQV